MELMIDGVTSALGWKEWRLIDGAPTVLLCVFGFPQESVGVLDGRTVTSLSNMCASFTLFLNLPLEHCGPESIMSIL